MTLDLVSEMEKLRAVASVTSHPLYREVVAWPHYTVDVEAEAIEFIARTRFSEEDKTSIAKALVGEGIVLQVSYMTSEHERQSLSGGGKHYIFLVHPVSFEVIYSRIGTWRA